MNNMLLTAVLIFAKFIERSRISDVFIWSAEEKSIEYNF